MQSACRIWHIEDILCKMADEGDGGQILYALNIIHSILKVLCFVVPCYLFELT